MQCSIAIVAVISIALSLCNATLTPYHVYLSLTGVASEMRLTWTTDSAPPSPMIQYWLLSEPTKKMTVYASTSDIVHFVTPYNHNEWIVGVTMIDLVAGQIYNYTIASDKSSPPEKAYQFKTLPNVNDSVNIMMYGDLGWDGLFLNYIGDNSLTNWAKARKMDFVIHFGDLAYNLGSYNGVAGDRFMSNIQYTSTRMPYIVTPGNHEYANEGGDEKMYRGWFTGQIKLGDNSLSTDPMMWHSYDVGDKLHMIGINTEVYCEAPDSLATQWTWLLKDLTTVRARKIQPWIIVYGHRQLYDNTLATFHQRLMRYGIQCTNSSHTKCDISKPCLSGVNCAYSLEDLFNDYHVDMYFAGHMHKYNRMLPIGQNLQYEKQEPNIHINAQHPVYIISGAPGLNPRNSTPEAHAHSTDGGPEIAAPTVISNMDHSFSILTVYNFTHLRLQQSFINKTGDLDDFWLVKDSTRPPWTVMGDFTLSATNATICDQ